ncbi:LppM family (lipo)protein [Demequina salsinemoris]|uniref:LppM family (lipo)protein n=1 Tax=Demequina salsinemoris TaxID=577470 RepID=UPI0007811FFA|nr:hypothetical protein [Demequina salsinemoris]
MNATLTRAGRAIAVALFATLALTGCIKVDFELVLQPDDTVDGSITYAIAQGSGELMSDDETTYTDEDLLDSLFGDIDASEYANGVLSDFTDDDWVGKTITFEGEELSGFSLDEDTEGVTITREGDEFVISGPYSTSEEDMTEGMDGAEMSMTVTFPGEITETNGTLSEDKHTVTWDLLDPPESLEARGGATEGSDFPMWIVYVAAGVVALAAIVVVVVVLVSRKGKKKGSEAEGADETTAGVAAAPMMLPVDAIPATPGEVPGDVVIPDADDEPPFEPTPKEDESTPTEILPTEESEDDAAAEDEESVADEDEDHGADAWDDDEVDAWDDDPIDDDGDVKD